MNDYVDFAGFKPMRAATCKDLKIARFPLLGSPKIDGIRCVLTPDGPKTKSMKAVRNNHVRATLNQFIDEYTPYEPWLDGELVIGNPLDPRTWNETSSGIMSINGKPDFTFLVFDIVGDKVYKARYNFLKDLIKEARHKFPFLRHVPQAPIKNLKELTDFEEACVKEGYEGIMLRNPLSEYKRGTATLTQWQLVKHKRVLDIEGEIIGFEEEMHNANEAETNELGNTKRSGKKGGMVGKGFIGAFIMRATFPENEKGLINTPVEFNMSANVFNAEKSEEWKREQWRNRKKLLGKKVTFKYASVGVNGKPRFPVFLRFRPEE